MLPSTELRCWRKHSASVFFKHRLESSTNLCHQRGTTGEVEKFHSSMLVITRSMTTALTGDPIEKNKYTVVCIPLQSEKPISQYKFQQIYNFWLAEGSSFFPSFGLWEFCLNSISHQPYRNGSEKWHNIRGQEFLVIRECYTSYCLVRFLVPSLSPYIWYVGAPNAAVYWPFSTEYPSSVIILILGSGVGYASIQLQFPPPMPWFLLEVLHQV